MKNVGTFTIDEFGRILIPADVRNTLGWETGSKLSMFYTDDNKAILQPTAGPGKRVYPIYKEETGTTIVGGQITCAS